MGGTISLDVLAPQTWVAGCDIVTVLVAVRQAIIEGGSAVDLVSDHDTYSQEEAAAAAFRSARTLPRSVGSFNVNYECFSPTVGDRPDLERGGKSMMFVSAALLLFVLPFVSHCSYMSHISLQCCCRRLRWRSWPVIRALSFRFCFVSLPREAHAPIAVCTNSRHQRERLSCPSGYGLIDSVCIYVCVYF